MTFRKFIVTVLLFGAVASPISAQEGNVYQNVTEYLQTLVAEPVPVIIEKMDNLLEAGADIHIRSQIAGIAFDFFSHSPVMGQESVAVHIADNWFLNKRLEWPDQSTYPQLYTYAQFNRESLIGNSAPELTMEDDCGLEVSVRKLQSDYKLLYFFDDQCSSCRKETPALASYVSSYSGQHLTLVLIYTQSDRQSWLSYVNEYFGEIDNPDVDIVTLWDPDSESGYHMKYAVLSTPQMVLLDYQNVIIGRGLNCDALEQLLGVENEYWEQSSTLLDACFENAGEDAGSLAVEMADAYYARYCNDTSIFRSAFHDLFGYLRNSYDSGLQDAAISIADKYILGHPEYWAKDYVQRVSSSIAAASLNPPGSVPANLTLSDEKGRTRNLLSPARRLRRNTLILFHLVSCSECAAKVDQLISEAARIRKGKYDVKLVYVGKDQSSWLDFVFDVRNRIGRRCHWQFLWDPDSSSGMDTLYDLEFVPHLYLLDADNKVMAKDIPLDVLTYSVPEK